jgi:transcriptional regulator with XRE-family HTH domain
MDRHKFKAARLAQNMSQGALAKAVRLSPSEISRIECGYRDMSPKEAQAIAAALGMTPPVTPAPVALPAVAAPAPVATHLAPIPAPPAPMAVLSVVSPPVIGSDLSDPVNFTELPDFGVLERGTLLPTAHRDRLVAALARATKILHTSRVRASVWREWRQFERKIHALLQAG